MLQYTDTCSFLPELFIKTHMYVSREEGTFKSLPTVIVLKHLPVENTAEKVGFLQWSIKLFRKVASLDTMHVNMEPVRIMQTFLCMYVVHA